MIEIRADEALARAEHLLERIPGATEIVVRKAIRDSIRGIKGDAIKKVQERYTIDQQHISSALKVQNRDMGAALVARGRVNDLSYFKTNPSWPPAHRPPTGQYTYAEVVRGQGGTIAHAFLAKMRSGHVGVFRRTSNASLPINKLSGPSTPQMLEHPSIADFIKKRLQERTEQMITKNLEKEIGKYLGG